MQREVWSKACRYKVFSGDRIAVSTLTKHIASNMMTAGHRGLVSYEGQPTICYGCGETGHFSQVCPKRRRVGIATTKKPTVSWADIAGSGTRSAWCDGGEEEEADHQSTQTGYGDEHQAEDGEAMQEDNTRPTGVTSEHSEEQERGAVDGSYVRNDKKAPCVEGRPGVEDSMDCGEEILGETNVTVESLPLLRQPQEDMSSTTVVREEEEHGRERQEIRIGGVVEEHTQPVDEVGTGAPSSRPRRTKK